MDFFKSFIRTHFDLISVLIRYYETKLTLEVCSFFLMVYDFINSDTQLESRMLLDFQNFEPNFL